jgi:glycogen debranching enzyme
MPDLPDFETQDLSRLDEHEWLQANRRGSFAMGCIDRIPRRRYHSLLTLREPGEGEPLNAVAEIAETVVVGEHTWLLHALEYPTHVRPHGFAHLIEFKHDPLPTWRYRLGEMTLERTLQMDEDADVVWLRYQLEGVQEPVKIYLRPLLLCRPWHGLMRHNAFLNGAAVHGERGVRFKLYASAPTLHLGVIDAPYEYHTHGAWVEDIVHATEIERGYEGTEDYYHPGAFHLDFENDRAWMLRIAAELDPATVADLPRRPPRPRKPATSPSKKLRRAALPFRIRRDDGLHSIIAGYPWFGEWGRDTMIALPGLTLAVGKPEKAYEILRGYAERLIDGRVPNVLAAGDQPANTKSIDASLLFVRAVRLLLAHPEGQRLGGARLMPAVVEILEHMREGDEWAHVSPEGGLWVARGAWAPTWMDAMVDGEPVTPRHGYPVDVAALFIEAGRFLRDWATKEGEHDLAATWRKVTADAEAVFAERYWDPQRGFLADGHDGNEPDGSLRPNQLWALSMDEPPLPPEAAHASLANVRAALATPVGLRTLAPDDPRYVGRYAGGQAERDRAYHQGTVWPWLIGIYADAVARIEGKVAMRDELDPIVERLLEHLDSEACLGQISEVFDGSPPHAPGGAPAQAWSVAEVLRVARMLR